MYATPHATRPATTPQNPGQPPTTPGELARYAVGIAAALTGTWLLTTLVVPATTAWAAEHGWQGWAWWLAWVAGSTVGVDLTLRYRWQFGVWAIHGGGFFAVAMTVTAPIDWWLAVVTVVAAEAVWAGLFYAARTRTGGRRAH